VNENEIRKAINILHPNNTLFEIRAIDGKWNASGYFRSAEAAIEQLKVAKIRPKANIYITLNDISADCFSRTQSNKIIEYAKATTADSNITGYRWFMVDLDPKRVSDVSSSEEELEAAKSLANEIFAYMKHEGWYDPVIAMSGNGVHLLYSIALNNTQENKTLIQQALTSLCALFDSSKVKIDVDVDVTTFNPSRICKLYGTMAKKGANTPERPHRESYIQYVPKVIQINKKALLEQLASVIPQETSQNEKRFDYDYETASFDLDAWIKEHNLPVKAKEKWSGGEKWVLEHCVFDPSHTGKDAAIIRTNDGKICYNCFHNSCAQNHWRELRLKYEPNAYVKQHIDVDSSIKPNHMTARQNVIVTNLPDFLTTEQIRQMEKPHEEFIQSGITTIDSKMRGLKKGFVTCISGLRGCGKSSLISEITLNVANDGLTVALFSGELTAKNVQKWLTLQAAGKNNVIPTQYENYYTYSSETLEKISQWLDGKVYVYNNDYGNNYKEIEERLQKCILNNKVDLVILDNLMSMNLSNLSPDKYLQQSYFVERLETIAKQFNIHVIFVAHPRKSQGFLRLEDVSGSNDIVNRVDNAFIMHRVNDDFRRLTKETYRWRDDNPLYKATNVIEVCKDRDGGLQDLFIPLFFEPETKRLKNDQFENIIYGWQSEWKTDIDMPPF
jgi:replicative DNA helicase